MKGDIVFGDRILFRPNIAPSPRKFIQRSDSVDFSSCDWHLLGLFDFEPVDLTKSHVKQDPIYVVVTTGRYLLSEEHPPADYG